MKPILIALVAVVAGLAVLEAQDTTPRFRSGVDVLPIDITVVDGSGRQIRDLAAGDFKVSVGGDTRRVLSAEWISLARVAAPPPTPVPEGYSSNESATDGRLIVLVIDQRNIRFGGGRGIADAMNGFIDQLTDSDRLALVGIGRGVTSIPFTADHARIKDAVGRLTGQMQAPVQSPMTNVPMTLTTAVRLTRGDQALMERLLMNCPLIGRNGPDTCQAEITRQAEDLVIAATDERRATVRALLALLASLQLIDAPKSLVLVSEGLALFDGDGDATSELASIGPLAASARTSIYALRLGDQVFDATRARSAPPEDDAQIRLRGLETLTASARGTMFNVTSTGANAFERLESELSGYYLLSVEASPADRDRSSAPLRVQVSRKGAVVRARSTIAPAAAAEVAAQSPLAAAASALMSPLSVGTLPLRVITFNFQGSDPSTVQLLIHADIGRDYTAPQAVAVAYAVLNSAGTAVATESIVSRLGPRLWSIASPLPFSAGVGVPPGDYVLKIAVSDGVRVGSIEHPVHASLAGAGELKLSDLTAGGPVPSTSAPARPTVDDTIYFGALHGYLEAYGDAAALTSVHYEIAADDSSPALLVDDAAARQVNGRRASFSRLIRTAALPPGRYQLRARVSVNGVPATTLSRSFDIAKTDAGITAAPATPAAPAPADTIRTAGALDAATELFLPMDASDLVSPFKLTDALAPEALQIFTERVPTAAKAAFDEGVAQLGAGDTVAAAASFKTAIRQNTDFTAAVSYLAVTLAASGHDLEAAGAWQTALAGGGDLPQLYLWIGQALLRVREFPRAQSILEEAARRWPEDRRFARPLAMLYATTGKGFDALASLEKYLAGSPADADALFLGVQWIYQVHLSGKVLHDKPSDLALARTWSDAYTRANGNKQPLVNQWIGYLTQN
jgi:VWFA-related protein